MHRVSAMHGDPVLQFISRYVLTLRFRIERQHEQGRRLILVKKEDKPESAALAALLIRAFYSDFPQLALETGDCGRPD